MLVTDCSVSTLQPEYPRRASRDRYGQRHRQAAVLPWPRSSAIKAGGRTRRLGGAACGGRLTHTADEAGHFIALDLAASLTLLNRWLHNLSRSHGHGLVSMEPVRCTPHRF
jgi:hypothetical protein